MVPYYGVGQLQLMASKSSVLRTVSLPDSPELIRRTNGIRSHYCSQTGPMPNPTLQQTATVIPVLDKLPSLSAAAAAELVVRRRNPREVRVPHSRRQGGRSIQAGAARDRRNRHEFLTRFRGVDVEDYLNIVRARLSTRNYQIGERVQVGDSRFHLLAQKLRFGLPYEEDYFAFLTLTAPVRSEDIALCSKKVWTDALSSRLPSTFLARRLGGAILLVFPVILGDGFDPDVIKWVQDGQPEKSGLGCATPVLVDTARKSVVHFENVPFLGRAVVKNCKNIITRNLRY